MNNVFVIKRPSGYITMVRSALKVASEDPLMEHEEIITELSQAVITQLQIIKSLVHSERVVNLDEAISYYESLVRPYEI